MRHVIYTIPRTPQDRAEAVQRRQAAKLRLAKEQHEVRRVHDWDALSAYIDEQGA